MKDKPIEAGTTVEQLLLSCYKGSWERTPESISGELDINLFLSLMSKHLFTQADVYELISEMEGGDVTNGDFDIGTDWNKDKSKWVTADLSVLQEVEDKGESFGLNFKFPENTEGVVDNISMKRVVKFGKWKLFIPILFFKKYKKGKTYKVSYNINVEA